MLGLSNVNEMRKAAQNPHESDLMNAFATIYATREYRLLEAVEELHRAADVEDPMTIQDVEEGVAARKEGLLDAVDALTSGEFQRWWFSEGPGSEHLDDPEGALEYVGLPVDEWERQVERWADSYRERGVEAPDRDLADKHLRTRHGVGIEEFEREVVNWERRAALRTIFEGNLTAVERGIHRTTEAVDGVEDGE
jgi:hypothetical protein